MLRKLWMSILLYNKGPIPDQMTHGLVYMQYRDLLMKGFTISRSENNCNVRVEYYVVLVGNILHNAHTDVTYIVIEKFAMVEDFYTYPIKSSSLGIYQLSQHTGELSIVPANSIQYKYTLLPPGAKYVVYPLQILA